MHTHVHMHTHIRTHARTHGPCHAAVLQAGMEFLNTSLLAESTAASVSFGVDRQEAVEKLVKLRDRLGGIGQVGCGWRQQGRCVCVCVRE